MKPERRQETNNPTLDGLRGDGEVVMLGDLATPERVQAGRDALELAALLWARKVAPR
ncbi:MAG: hypothetical protein GVY12_16690 [Bacteroidetes bacterium]|jgi:hypothetical protein|nr:hypothetical protein [Bacteroidota bacterium]